MNTKKFEDKEAYYKLKIEFEGQRREVDHADWLQRRKDKLVYQAERKEKVLEERKRALEDRLHPYQRELEYCEDLVQNCMSLKAKAGLLEVEKTLEDHEKEFCNELATKDLEKRVEEGKLQRVKTKDERATEA